MRLIDADAFEESVDYIEWYHLAESGEMVQGATSKNAWYKATDIYNAINNAPTIEAKPVVHAHWMKKHSLHHICSECHHDAPYKMNGYDAMENLSVYCPNCGAQMDEKED